MDHAEKLRKEYFTYRGVSIQSYMVLGPPLTGKTTLAKRLGETEGLEVITTKEIADYAYEAVLS